MDGALQLVAVAAACWLALRLVPLAGPAATARLREAQGFGSGAMTDWRGKLAALAETGRDVEMRSTAPGLEGGPGDGALTGASPLGGGTGTAGAGARMLALAPELRDAVAALRSARAPGTDGQLDEIEAAATRFAALAYRYIGRDPGRADADDRAVALEDMATARAELVNAVQALYYATRRETRLRVIDKATHDILDATEAYIAAARRSLNRLRLAPDNLYEPGRGFPRPAPAPCLGGASITTELYQVMV